MTTARPGPAAPARAIRGALGVVLVALALVVGLIAGTRLAAVPDVPATASVDAGFARDMSTHHAQAVQMSVLVREAVQDPGLRTVALDVELTQQHQAGQMFAWLEDWGLAQSTSAPAMAWMRDHAGHDEPAADGLMPGMATRAELNQLATATGVEAERRYLQLMIPHHEAGVEMAEYAVRNAEEEVVRRLAETIVASQTKELTVLRDLLDARGGPIS